MLWLDSVLSVPAVGIRIDLDIREIINFRDNVVPFFAYLKDKYNFIEIKQKEIVGYVIDTPSPSFQILPKNIVADYEYNVTKKDISGDFPVIEKPELIIYSDILNMLLEDIKYIINILKGIKDITYDRIGIVAKANLSKDSIPPGVITLIEYLGKPWGTKLLKSESLFFLRFLETDKYYDQCHHLIKFDETVPEKGYELKLDWQRLYKYKLNIDFDKVASELESCRLEAGKYFEKFGAGDLNYE